MMDLQVYKRAINRMYQQILMVIGRGRTTVVDDTGVVQYAQVVLGFNEVRDNTPRVAEYGFTSNPPTGTDCILAFIAGDRSNGCIIATNNQKYRITGLETGEVALYDMFGNQVYLNMNGIIVKDFNGNQMTMNGTGIKFVTPGLFDVEAADVRLHGANTFKWDAGGNGPSYTPTTRTDYVIGSTGTSQSLHPPEIP